MRNVTRNIQYCSLCVVLLLTGCASQPDRVAELENARTAVHSASSNPAVQRYAGSEVEQAEDALATADRAWSDGKDLDTIRHEAYLATRHAEIAIERGEEQSIQDRIERSESQRSEVLLQARSRDVASAESVAAAATAQARALEAQLDAMTAEQARQGLVLILGDVLFDIDKAALKPGANRALDRLAAFMADNPQRKILIEGHTDATGSSRYNTSLASDRAQAVAQALTVRGVSPERITVRAMGEAYPVATNETEAGRQENRRVAVVVSDKSGNFPKATSARP